MISSETSFKGFFMSLINCQQNSQENLVAYVTPSGLQKSCLGLESYMYMYIYM